MWYKIYENYITINIIVKPKAKRTELISVTNQGLHISLHALPKEGEANIELIKFLSDLYKVPKSHIEIIRGDKSRQKIVRVPYTASVKAFITKF